MASGIKLDQEDESIRRVFERVSTTLIFVSEAYAYCASYFSLDADQTKDLGEPLRFARKTYQYFMVLQYCKLFEKSNDKKQADSSLLKLNNLIFEKYKDKYPGFDVHLSELTSLMNSATFDLFRNLRDKTYAHGDNHSLNLQLKFHFLTEAQLAEFKSELVKTVEVFNRIHKFYGMEVTFHNFYDSTTPKNFLRNYFRNKEFFKRNFRNFKAGE